MASSGFESELWDAHLRHYEVNSAGFRTATSNCLHLKHFEDSFEKMDEDLWYGAIFVVPECYGDQWNSDKEKRMHVDMLTRRVGEFIGDNFSNLMRGSPQLQMAWENVIDEIGAQMFSLETLYASNEWHDDEIDFDAKPPLEFSLTWDEDARCSMLIVDGNREHRCGENRSLGRFAGMLVGEATVRVVGEWERENPGLRSTLNNVTNVAPLQSSKGGGRGRSGAIWSRTLFSPPWETYLTNGWSSTLLSRGLLDLVGVEGR